jgi:hypothetical protein
MGGDAGGRMSTRREKRRMPTVVSEERPVVDARRENARAT